MYFTSDKKVKWRNEITHSYYCSAILYKAEQNPMKKMNRMKILITRRKRKHNNQIKGLFCHPPLLPSCKIINSSLNN